MKRDVILVFCCFWVMVSGIAQNSNKFNKWKQETVNKGSNWSNYTRQATAAHNRNYYSLYVDGQFVASFADLGNCYAKKDELNRLAKQIFNKNTGSSGSNKKVREGLQRGLRDLGAASGVDANSLKSQLESKRDEAANTAPPDKTGIQPSVNYMDKYVAENSKDSKQQKKLEFELIETLIKKGLILQKLILCNTIPTCIIAVKVLFQILTKEVILNAN